MAYYAEYLQDSENTMMIPNSQPFLENDAALEDLKILEVQKPLLKVNEMTINKSYRILKARRVNTQYGERVIVELEKKQVFLPSRYDAMRDSTLVSLCSGQYCMINKGVKGRSCEIEFMKLNL